MIAPSGELATCVSAKLIRFLIKLAVISSYKASILTEIGTGPSPVVHNGAHVAEGLGLEVEDLGQRGRLAHLEFGEDASSHLVDLSLDAALEEVHHIGDFGVLAQHAEGVDFQRDADRLGVA